MRFLLSLLVLLSLSVTAAAQERPSTILVMDGSGSMWGQIDGINKIVIARDVVADILSDFPEDQNLGLTVYGHRTRGDCADIETVVPPAPGTAAGIVEAVNAINPRGMTPMTDAIVAAATELRYTEQAATVILVSDGIETCNPDPCAAARALEAAGVDFTAHVIGFDVESDPEALSQMQCLAAETGGIFLSADNAAELSEALATVAAADPVPPAGPEPRLVVFNATVGDGGPVVASPLVWEVTGGDARQVTGLEDDTFTLTLAPGDYRTVAVRPEDGTSAEATFSIAPGATGEDIVVTVVFPEPAATPVSVTFRATLGEDGPEIDLPLLWDVSGNDGDAATDESAPTLILDLAPGAYRVAATRPSDGATATSDVIVGDADQTVTVVFGPVLQKASLTAFDTAPLGATIPVGWDGPGEEGDFVAVAVPGEDGYVNYEYTSRGNPVEVQMPPAAGDYELRYISNTSREVLGVRPIAVTPIDVALEAASEAVAGSTMPVGWTGPDYASDYVAVAVPGDDDYINYEYTSRGNPTNVQMPLDPGTYELRYVLSQGRTVMATREITVTALGVSLDAPETAIAGDMVQVGWSGPDYPSDYIAVGVPGAEDYINYEYTSRGNPTEVEMPAAPGTYELRYVANQDRRILATRSIEVTDLSVTLDAPDEAVAGADVRVGWTGPDYDLDYIAVGLPGEDSYVNYAYTQSGNPTVIAMPTEPGDYELRYVLNQGAETIATRPITVTPLEVTLDAPPEAVAGATIPVGWTGPDYDLDYIAVGRPGEDGYIGYAYTSAGNPTPIAMPTEPGTYELRYVLNQGARVAAVRPITVTDLAVTVAAPEEVAQGATVPVDWTGPDYEGDFIGVGLPGNSAYLTYAYTSGGNPAQVVMPVEPGQYEIRYYLNQDQSIAARTTVLVTPIEVRLLAAGPAPAGGTVTVGWDGPDYEGDYISVGRRGEADYLTYEYTAQGNPLTLTLPDVPGEYELRYQLQQGGVILARVPLPVTAQ